MEGLARNGNAVIRVVDIDTWGSPVAEQHGINGIPHLVLYENGREVASGTGPVLQALQQ